MATYLKLTEESIHNLGYGAQKLKTAHPVTYFPGFLGRNIKNCPPIKLFLFTSLLEASLFVCLSTLQACAAAPDLETHIPFIHDFNENTVQAWSIHVGFW